MSRKQSRSAAPPGRHPRISTRTTSATLPAAALALAASLALWKAAPLLDKQSAAAWLAGAGLLALHSLLAVCLGESLAKYFAIRIAFRFGFLISLGSAACAALAWQLSSQTPGWWPFMLAAWSGASLGALFLSSLHGGLWEDNFPPTPDIQAAVLEWHRVEIGLPAPISPAKRVFDLLLASAGLLAVLPLCLVAVLLIWLEDPGPVLFVKNSVGRGGVNFRQFKFRTMERDAERETGPVLARANDARLLRTGHLMRKTGFDELPQLINILLGQMSFVGPRPQRTVLVHGYLHSVPGYAARHQVAPGLTGLAQVAGSYFASPEEKLAWDMRYIRGAGLLADLRLIGQTLLLVLWHRWQRNFRF